MAEGDNLNIEIVKFEKFLELRGSQKEGLVFLGAGGDPNEWINGVSELLSKEGVAESSNSDILWDRFFLTLTTGGRRDLLFLFKKDSSIDFGKLAMWRLRFGDCSWLSDYVVNYADQHGIISEVDDIEDE